LFFFPHQLDLVAEEREKLQTTHRFLTWYENDHVDSLKSFLSTKEYLFYDDIQVILNEINNLYLENDVRKAQKLHDLINWLGDYYKKTAHTSFLLNINKKYQSWSNLQRQQKQTADSLVAVANELRSDYEIEESKSFRNQAIEIYRQVGDSLLFVRQMSEFGLPTYSTENYEIMLDLFKNGIIISRLIHDKKGEGLIFILLGYLHEDHGKLLEAPGNYSQANRLFVELKDKENQARALGSLGITNFKLNHYDQSMKNFKQVLKISQETSNTLLEEKAYNNIGILNEESGNYFEALKYYNRALDLARKIGNKMAEGNVLGNMGPIYRLLGNYELANKCYGQSLEIAKATGDLDTYANILNNIGVLYSSRGEYENALVKYNEAIKINKKKMIMRD